MFSEKFWLLILSLSLCFCFGCAINPITGEEEFMLFPEQKDVVIGKKYAPEAEKQMGGRISNESIQSYIDNVGQRVARVSHRPDLEYHFVAVEHESINAIALPGGYIFITKGLLQKLTNEAQLGGILSHEVAHIVARDSSVAISREIGIGILLAAAVTQDAPSDVLTAADITRQILSLQYSRKDEQEADLAGLDYMVQAGYDPYGMIETMKMLQDEQKVKPIEFFSTHPLPKNRIEYLTRKIEAKYSDFKGLKIGSEDFHRAILEDLTNNKTE
jgi:predicted Zn-dependent protease